jgi:hypothetical protein
MRQSIIGGPSGPTSRSSGTAAVAAVASVMLTLVGIRAASAASCSATISSCGCAISSAAVFTTSGPLASASSSVDCIDISASGAVLIVAGDITGPGGGVTADGIHIMSGVSNVFIAGKTTPGFSTTHAKVTGFATGLQIDGPNAEINELDADVNVNNGVVFNNVTGGDWNDSAASSNAGGDGVLISGGSSNIVGDAFPIDMNGKNGIEISSSANNRILDSGADHNSVYGIWFGQSNGNEINGTATNSNATGTYIGCSPTGGPTGKKCPGGKNSQFNSMTNSGGNTNSDAGVAIDSGASGNVVDESGGSSNTADDAVDKNKKCDHNVWIENSFTKVSQSCIH